MPRRGLRLVLLFVLLAGLYAYGRHSGASAWFQREALQQHIARSGPLGALVYCAVFSIGELLHVPGLVFVAAGVLAWGRLLGGGLAFLAALLSISVAFFVVRGVAGGALAGVDRRRPLLSRLLRHLDERPIRTVALLRLVFVLWPGVNYALALSRVRYRDYLAGSALGLLLPLTVVAVGLEWFLRFL
jgi:uncharacterized membrane protein YdjX (TVP38/TMEM64 family)